MQKAEIDQLVSQLIGDWFASRITPNIDLSNTVTLQHSAIKSIVNLAFKHGNDLKDELVASEGIDLHKIASSVARAITAHQELFVVKRSTGYDIEEIKLDCIVDCSLTVFLSILRCDRASIERETNTWGALRKLFSQHNHTSLLSLSMIAFLLEKTYPEV